MAKKRRSKAGAKTGDRRGEVVRLLARREREVLTYQELSRRCGIPAGTLAWWQRRLKEGRESGAVARKPGGQRRPADRKVRFVEAAVVDAARGPQRGARYELVLTSGRRLLLEEGFRPGSVRALVEALEGRC